MSDASRLQRLEDERAIERALYDYSHFADNGPRESLRDCFTPDNSGEKRWRGVTESKSVADPSKPFRPTWKPNPISKHATTTPRITSLTGDTATVESYWTFIIGDTEDPHVQSYGRYIDTLKRGADGKWRIHHRITDVEGRTKARQLSGHH